eukprot:2013513-Alexandrium_andersonii.AAC.1
MPLLKVLGLAVGLAQPGPRALPCKLEAVGEARGAISWAGAGAACGAAGAGACGGTGRKVGAAIG